MIHFPLLTMLGAAAGAMSIASFAPQAWKVITTQDVSGMSISMYWFTVATFGLWLTYGILLSNWALIIPNFICLILATFILCMLFVSPRRRAEIARKISGNKTSAKS